MSDKPGPGPGTGAGSRSFARSLYWRIGFGFILFLAITLILQVGLFIWVAGETEGGMPERMGRDFAELVASEFEAALARDPKLDLRAYARASRQGAASSGRDHLSGWIGDRAGGDRDTAEACAFPGRSGVEAAVRAVRVVRPPDRAA